MLPSISVAAASNVTVPLATVLVSHCTLYGADVTVPMNFPFARNLTSEMPMLSLAVALTVTIAGGARRAAFGTSIHRSAQTPDCEGAPRSRGMISTAQRCARQRDGEVRHATGSA